MNILSRYGINIKQIESDTSLFCFSVKVGKQIIINLIWLLFKPIFQNTFEEIAG